MRASTFLLCAFASLAAWLLAYYFVPETTAHSGRDRSILENKASRSPNGHPNFLTQSFAIMRFPEVKHWTNWDDSGRINLSVRHVIVALDVIETDSVYDAWLLI